MWADGASEEETSEPGSGGSDREYVNMLSDMRHLGITGLNLDVRNLKAFPSTVKLWHQLQAYPHEIIPLMDQAIKDIIVDQAEEEMNRLRSDQQLQRAQARPDSSMPAVPSSETNGHADPQSMIPDLVQEAETKIYKVKPFGLDKSVNMRELNPNGVYLFPAAGSMRLILDRYGQGGQHQGSCDSDYACHTRHEDSILPMPSL